MKLGDMLPATFCVARYSDGMWYRGFITQVYGPTFCRVFFIDYGESVNADLKEIRFLPAVFSRLPAQAFEACLENIWDKKSEALKNKSKSVS